LDLLVDLQGYWSGFPTKQAKQNLQGDDGLLESMLALTCKGEVSRNGCLWCIVNYLLAFCSASALDHSNFESQLELRVMHSWTLLDKVVVMLLFP
jgi:hypothetical protein